LFSLVVPVYRNEDTLPALIEGLEFANRQLGGRLEAVFVVDGSPDRSLPVLRELLDAASFQSQLIALSRNFGSFAAIRQGLEAACGPFFAVMAADLQEPLELPMEFFQRLARGDVDVVIGERVSRRDPVLAAFAANVFWSTYRLLIQPEIPRGGVDVFGCNLAVRDALLRLREANSSLVGLLFWVGFRRVSVPYSRQPRPSGASGWTFRRKARYLADSAFAFTDLPISVLLWAGALGVAGSVAMACVVLVMRLTGKITVSGYTPIMLAMLFSASMILFALGIVGSYVWRTYENSKGRPLYIPLSHEVFGKETPE
jgi:glycosyltransferase involved in cell wall biosynthesis